MPNSNELLNLLILDKIKKEKTVSESNRNLLYLEIDNANINTVKEKQKVERRVIIIDL